MANTVPFEKSEVENYLRRCVLHWRVKDAEGDEKAKYYIDAFQSVHTTLFDELVPAQPSAQSTGGTGDQDGDALDRTTASGRPKSVRRFVQERIVEIDMVVLKSRIDEIYEDKKHDEGWEAWSALCLWLAQYENSQQSVQRLKGIKMDFEEFVDTLYKIGWRADGDAQHTQIRELWDLLIERGLLVHKGGLTRRAPDFASSPTNSGLDPRNATCPKIDIRHYPQSG